MFGFARTSVLLLICCAMVNNSYSTKVKDNNEEFFEADELLPSRTHSNKYSITNFQVENDKKNSTMGFSVSLKKVLIAKDFTGCYFQEQYLASYDVAFLILDFVHNQIQINCSRSLEYFWIYEHEYSKKPDQLTSDTTFKPLTMRKVKSDEKYSYYDFQFYIKLGLKDYALYFHNCDGDKVSYDLKYELVSNNYDFSPPSKPVYDVFSIVLSIILCSWFLFLGLYWVYVYKTSQNTLKNFHYILLVIVFLQALYYLLVAIKWSLTDFNSSIEEIEHFTDPLIDLTNGLKFCCIVTLAIQGWIYVKNIFGPMEKYFVMSILIVQSVLWMFVYIHQQLHLPIGYYILYMHFIELFLVAVVLVYLLIRRADWRKDKAVGNSKKFQLFRFVCLLVAFLFYFFTFSMMYMLYKSQTGYKNNLRMFLRNHETISIVLFYPILFYKLRPTLINEISALKTAFNN